MHRRTLLIGVDIALFLAGALLVLAMLWQSFRISFAIEGLPPTPTPAQVSTYDVTASTCVALCLAAFVLALVIRRTFAVVFGILGGIGLVLALVVCVFFSIPNGRWMPGAPRTSTTDTPAIGQTPCYSGSTSCN